MSGADWHPVAIAEAIAPATCAGVVIEGREVVVWRDGTGRLRAWQDRCPHRGMKLSFGFVRGDRLTCLYHGWAYDGQGRCRHIPAHPDLEIPPTIAVEQHAVCEAAGLVWVAVAHGSQTAPHPPGQPASAARSLYVDRPLGVLVEALRTAPGVALGAEVARLLAFELEGRPLLAGLHECDGEHSALHIVLAQDTADAAARKAVAAWATTLRRRAEAV